MKNKINLLSFLLTLTFVFSSSYAQNDVLTSAFDKLTDSIISNTKIPGLVVGVWDNSKNLTYVTAKGKADIEKNIPMAADLLFRIGSNTKTFTITVFLQLADEKKISLDDKLSKYFPDIPNSDSVSLEMLCNMTSGIFNYSETEEFGKAFVDNPEKTWTPQELVNLGTSKPYYFPVGKGFHYSNTNTIIIGMIIEQVTSNKLETEIKNRIIDKLGLEHTYFATGKYMVGNYCHGYEAVPDSITGKRADVTDEVDISWAWSAGAMVSNIYDLKTYVKALTDGTFLKPETQKRRLQLGSISSNQNAGYGLGIFSYAGFLGHNGGLPGFNSFMMRYPEKDCTIIMFYNVQSEKNTIDMLGIQFIKLLYPEIWKE
jgi:D-alanyl-D-alanine carboxypeptidase